jgi:hypothetical protein
MRARYYVSTPRQGNRIPDIRKVWESPQGYLLYVQPKLH